MFLFYSFYLVDNGYLIEILICISLITKQLFIFSYFIAFRMFYFVEYLLRNFSPFLSFFISILNSSLVSFICVINNFLQPEAGLFILSTVPFYKQSFFIFKLYKCMNLFLYGQLALCKWFKKSFQKMFSYIHV